MTENKIRSVSVSIKELNEVNTNIKCTEDGCPAILKSKSNLNMHYVKHHLKQNLISNKEQLIYHCPIDTCIYNINGSRWFTQKRFLKQHCLKVHADKKFLCEKCQKGFPTLAAKNNHFKVCGVIFTCLICKWEYKSSEALLTHCRRKNHYAKADNDYDKEAKPKLEVEGKPLPFPIYIVHLPENVNKKVTADKEIQTESDNYIKEKLIKKRNTVKDKTIKREHQSSKHTQTCTKAKKVKSSVKTQTVKNNIIEKAMHNANICVHATTETQTSPSNYKPQHVFLKPKSSNTSCTTRSDESGMSIKPKIEGNKKRSHIILNQKDFNIDMFKNEDTEITNDTRTDNLNNLNYFEESTNGFEDTCCYEETNNYLKADTDLLSDIPSNLCSIETQTDQLHDFLKENTDTTYTQTSDISIDQMLYVNMCTQTCDEFILSELGLNDIHTQTNWPQYDDLVSTETQTSFTQQSLLGDNSTQTNSFSGVFDGQSTGTQTGVNNESHTLQVRNLQNYNDDLELFNLFNF